MQHRWPLLLLALLFSCALFSQTPISGIINTYASVISIDTCEQRLTIEQAEGFEATDTLLLIQMQGAEIITGNAPSFGSISNINNAGRFEKVIIEEVQGSDIILKNALLNAYDLNGQIQIVSVPYYESATVTAILQAKEWDGNTGGILALSAKTLTLEADIDVSGAGFRGGTQELDYTGDCVWFINYTNYSYNEESIRAGYKGEGISITDSSFARGKGANANGGGGGNDHNSGGGGGSNATAGGQGGTNNSPTAFGCSGNHPGLGGWEISLDTSRLFMGGGGGAGHINNSFSAQKADGGGIVLLDIGWLSANGFSIKANGDDATPTGGDGANGGGAGGTILIRTSAQDESALFLEARGGKGGNANNLNSDQCHGPGGGGAGGIILINPSLIFSPDIKGGIAGLSINSTSCGEGSNGATIGSDGLISIINTIPSSSSPIVVPDIEVLDDMVSTCAEGIATLIASIEGGNFNLQWQLDTGNGFENIQNDTLFQGVNTDSLVVLSPTTISDSYSFRLEVETDCSVFYSTPLSIDIIPVPTAAFDYSIDGLTTTFTNNSIAASNFTWFFATLENNMEINPVFEFPSAGFYEVVLIAENECGVDTVTQELQIGAPPVPIIGVEGFNSGCLPLEVQFNNLSQGDYVSLMWTFPGGQPASSTEENPIVLYEEVGVYNVQLSVFSGFPTVSTTESQLIEVFPQAIASFTYTIDGLTVSFVNNSIEADSYFWDFGDGNFSEEVNPSYTYTEAGNYTVTLNASNNNCTATIDSSVFIQPNSTKGFFATPSINLFPNPTNGELCVQTDWPWRDYQLYNSVGKLIRHGTKEADCFDFSFLPPGTYWLQLSDQVEWVHLPLIIQR